MAISIVEFEVYQEIPPEQRIFDPPSPQEALSKDGLVLCVHGSIGAMDGEFESVGYDLFRDLFEDVNISSFWVPGNNDIICQHVFCVFNIWWETDYEGYESDCKIEYLGVADASKWTAQTLPAIRAPAN